MALWTFTQMSEMLECSPQNIHQKKAKLKKLGYVEVDPVDNKEKINENGYNYLLNTRKNTMQMNNNNLNNTCLKDIENIENSSNMSFKQDTFTVEVEFLKKQNEELKKQLEEEKNQTRYWQQLYVKENEEYKRLTTPLMLGTTEQNKKQEEQTKKSFWQKIFG